MQIDFHQKTVSNTECGAHSWIPYDLSMSPFDNLYADASDLNPQPEYPLRNILDAPYVQSIRDLKVGDNQQYDNAETLAIEEQTDIVMPFKTLLCLWMIGLYVWYKIFVPSNDNKIKRKKRVLGVVAGKDSKKIG